MIEMICTNCGHPLQVPASYAGQRGRCRHCGAEIHVPAVLGQVETGDAGDAEVPPGRGGSWPFSRFAEGDWLGFFRRNGLALALLVAAAVALPFIVMVAKELWWREQNTIAAPTSWRRNSLFGKRVARPKLDIDKAFGRFATRQEYDRLEPGMTYKQVSTVIGSMGMETRKGPPELGTGSVPAKIYEWYGVGEENARMWCRFENGGLVTKHERGLGEVPKLSGAARF